MAPKNDKRQFVFSDAVLFDVILLGGFLLLAVVSFNYNPRARSIPLALSAIGSVMIFLQFLVDGFPHLRSKLPFVSEGGLLAGQKRSAESGGEVREDAAAGQSEPARQQTSGESMKVWWRVLRLVLWLLGFIILLGNLHYLIAVGGFVALVTFIEARESWQKSLLLAAGVCAGFYVLFDLILKAQI